MFINKLSSIRDKFSILQIGAAVFLATLPDTIIFGTIIFAALGSDWIGLGIVSCFVAHIIARTISIFISSNVEIVLAPSSYSALILSSVVVLTIGSFENLNIEFDKEIIALQTALLVGVLSGLFQLLFYKMKVSDIVQFLPYELVANVVNLTAILIIIKQTPVLLFTNEIHTISDLGDFNINFFTVTIGIFCMVPIVYKNLFTRVQTPVLSFLFGIIAFHIMANFDFQTNITMLPTIRLPDIQSVALLLNPSALTFIQYDFELIFFLFAAALSLAILNSLSLLIASKQVQDKFDRSNKKSKDLLANSITNTIAPVLGGIPCTGKIGVTVWALKNGTYGRSIAIIVASFYGFLIFNAHYFFQFVPYSVIAGVSIVVACELFDKRLISIFNKIGRFEIRSLREDVGFFTMLIAMLIAALFGNFLLSLIVGFAIALIEFVIKVSNYSIKTSSLSNLNSRTQRPASNSRIIKRELSKGILLEIKGFLLFLSAEKIREKLEKVVGNECKIIVIDLSKIYYADTAGVAFVVQKIISLMKANFDVYLVVSNSELQKKISIEMHDSFVQKLREKIIFSNLNELLLTLEEEILVKHQGVAANFNLKGSELFDGMKDIQRAKILSLMTKIDFKKGENIQKTKEPTLFLIIKGSIDVLQSAETDNSATTNNDLKILRCLPGSLIGEVSFLDGQDRSANLKAIEHTQCQLLSKNSFQKLKTEDPNLALLLLENIAKCLSFKLRYSNKNLLHPN